MFILRDVEEELEDFRAIFVEVLFEVVDGGVALLPDEIEIADKMFCGHTLVLGEDFRVNPDDEDFLVVGAIKDANGAALGKGKVRSPEEIVI